MVKKGKRQGFLVVVLIMSLLFFIIAVAVCSFLGVQYSIMGESEQSLRALYAADSGVQYALALMGLMNTTTSEKYFGYTSNYAAIRPRSFSQLTLVGDPGGSDPTWIARLPMAVENSLYGARDYGETDFTWRLLWDDGVGKAVYFSVVRALYFPNNVEIINTAGTAFNPNQAGSNNEQISGTRLTGTTSDDEAGNPAFTPVPIPPGCSFRYYRQPGFPACQETDNTDHKHYHCRYTIKSIGEVWAYHGPSTARILDRVLARRTVMAEIITRDAVDKRSYSATYPLVVSDARILRWYEVLR